MLIINASTILHLNQTATEYAYYLIHETPLEEAAGIVAKRYQVKRSDARSDFIEISKKIYNLLEVPDLDPVSFLDFSGEKYYSRKPFQFLITWIALSLISYPKIVSLISLLLEELIEN